MAEQNFVDYVKLYLRSGKGGAGSTHFERSRYDPKGGPDGGNGGRGGHIILKGNRQMWTLLPLKYRKNIHAPNGDVGRGNTSSGAQGEDVILEVPIGTIALDAETGEIDFEITKDGETQILVQGGRGGLGNSNFKSATNQSPRYAQPGEEGIETVKILELKIIADVGLVGFPNAGKSTLLSVLSAAKPKIANYAFTTLTPNLGIVFYRDTRSFVMADIPGIIENAHLGKGLGLRFLRHIERNAVLLFLIPADSQDINKEYQILVNELEEYNPELKYKPRLVAITKSDMVDEEMKSLLIQDIQLPVEYMFISSVAQQGLQEIKDKLWLMLNAGEEEIR
jgi:GTP-binding protein